MLTAIEELGFEDTQRMYRFQCDCGNIVIRKLKEVRRGKIISCGCAVVTNVRKANTTHGMTNTRIYEIYRNMVERCSNEKSDAFQHYGGRGISICAEWSGKGGFEKFYRWSMNNGYEATLSIDRIDVNGNYEPNNCRWANSKTQARNKQDTWIEELNGIRKPAIEWCEELGLNYQAVHKRVKKYGYTFEKAVTYRIHKIQSNKLQ